MTGTDAGRLWRIHEALSAGNGQADPLGRIKLVCRVCVDLLPVAGAGVMLMAERVHQGTLWATDTTIQALEELQNDAGEGPCIDAYTVGHPVLEPDMAGHGAQLWPRLARGVLEAGIQALYSFPLQLDDTSLGALNLYQRHATPLSEEQVADARLLAAVVTREVLAMQATAVPGSLPDQVDDLPGDRSAIEQATGMVAVQLNETVAQAAHHLRETAATQRRSLAEVAHDIVTRKLRLD